MAKRLAWAILLSLAVAICCLIVAATITEPGLVLIAGAVGFGLLVTWAFGTVTEDADQRGTHD